jgi:hypothetical protein
MTGQRAFEQMAEFADQKLKAPEPISQEDFELWQYDYTWDALHGIRYGQSFCNRFGITDNLLYYTTWDYIQIEEYIKRTYVDRSGI